MWMSEVNFYKKIHCYVMCVAVLPVVKSVHQVPTLCLRRPEEGSRFPRIVNHNVDALSSVELILFVQPYMGSRD